MVLALGGLRGVVDLLEAAVDIIRKTHIVVAQRGVKLMK